LQQAGPLGDPVEKDPGHVLVCKVVVFAYHDSLFLSRQHKDHSMAEWRIVFSAAFFDAVLYLLWLFNTNSLLIDMFHSGE